MNAKSASPVGSDVKGWAVLITCVVGLLVAWRPTVTLIVDSWVTNPFGHGYFIVPAVAYLIWRQRGELAHVNLRPSLVGLVALAVLAFAWLLARLSVTSIAQQVCLVAAIPCIVWAVAGQRAARALLFPLGLLLFALPIGDRLVPILQDAMASFAVRLLRLVGFPALLEGHLITIPGSSWEVAHACSGINYLVTSMTVGYVYAGIVYREWRHRIGFFVASAFMPLLANGFRVFTTIFIASLGRTQIAAGLEHNLYGLVVFAVIIYALLAICGGWRESEAGGVTEVMPKAAAASRRTVAPLLVAAVVALVVVGAAPVTAARLLRADQLNSQETRKAARVDGMWTRAAQVRFKWTPRFAPPAVTMTSAYVSGSSSVQLATAYFSSSQRGVKLATAGNELYDSLWHPTAAPRTVRPAAFSVREMQLKSVSSGLLVWSWYVVGDRSTSNDYWAKILLARQRLLGRDEGSVIVAIATEDRPDAAAVLTDFLRHLSWLDTEVGPDRRQAGSAP